MIFSSFAEEKDATQNQRPLWQVLRQDVRLRIGKHNIYPMLRCVKRNIEITPFELDFLACKIKPIEQANYLKVNM